MLHLLIEIERLLNQLNLSALKFAHIEHIIDEHQQLFDRSSLLLPVLLEFLDIIRIAVRHLNQTENSIDRRPNIMAHPRKKIRLRRICKIRLLVCLFKLLLLALKSAVRHLHFLMIILNLTDLLADISPDNDRTDVTILLPRRHQDGRADIFILMNIPVIVLTLSDSHLIALEQVRRRRIFKCPSIRVHRL